MSSSLDFTEEELHSIIKQQLTGPNKDLLAEAIFGICEDYDWKKEKIVKASLGIGSVSEHALNEEYKVRKENVSVYEIDYDDSVEKGYLDENGCVLCILKSFNPWASAMYEVEYTYIRNGKPHTTTYTTYGHYLTLAEEFPEDLI
jgi:hypothetical protein